MFSAIVRMNRDTQVHSRRCQNIGMVQRRRRVPPCQVLTWWPTLSVAPSLPKQRSSFFMPAMRHSFLLTRPAMVLRNFNTVSTNSRSIYAPGGWKTVRQCYRPKCTACGH